MHFDIIDAGGVGEVFQWGFSRSVTVRALSHDEMINMWADQKRRQT